MLKSFPSMKGMELLLPPTVDNTYRGHPLAYYFFIFLTILATLRSLAHILLPDGGAESIATIDVDVAGGDAIILLFAYWGLSQLILALWYLVVIVRYRSLIPLMYLTLVIEWTSRLIIGQFKPVETQGTAPGAIGNLILPFVCLLLLFLALRVHNREES